MQEFEKELRDNEVIYKIKTSDKLGIDRKYADKLFTEILDDAVDVLNKYGNPEIRFTIEAHGVTRKELQRAFQDYLNRRIRKADSRYYLSNILGSSIVSGTAGLFFGYLLTESSISEKLIDAIQVSRSKPYLEDDYLFGILSGIKQAYSGVLSVSGDLLMKLVGIIAVACSGAVAVLIYTILKNSKEAKRLDVAERLTLVGEDNQTIPSC